MSGFEAMLTGGHPNSLGRTEEVVEVVLAERDRLDELYRCWSSEDEVVRLRTASAIKRVAMAEPDWIVPYVDQLQSEIVAIDQASTQWTLALLFDLLVDRVTPTQRARAIEIMRTNLEHADWIVLNNSMQVLGRWERDDPSIGDWLSPHAVRLSGDRRNSVAKNARRLVEQLESGPTPS